MHRTDQQQRRRPARLAAGILAAVALVATGCGTRASDSELKALLQQNGSSAATGEQALPGAPGATGAADGTASGGAATGTESGATTVGGSAG